MKRIPTMIAVSGMLLLPTMSLSQSSVQDAEAKTLTVPEIRKILEASPDAAEHSSAFAALQALAEKGDINALGLLGYLLNQKGDIKGAADALQKASEKGSDYATLQLSEILIDDTTDPADPQKAISLLESLAEKGNKAALRKLLPIYRGKMAGIPGDAAKERQTMEALVEAGETQFAEAVGDMYISGNGGAMDGEGALKYYQISAESGNSAAWRKIGQLLLNVDLAPSDTKGALVALENAASSGDEKAKTALFQGHLKGEFGDESSKSEALKLAQDLVESGNKNAAYVLLRNADEAESEGIEISEALAVVEKLAEDGDATAQRVLYNLFSSDQAPDGSHEKLSAMIAKNPLIVPIMDRAKQAYSLSDYSTFAEEVRSYEGKSKMSAIRGLRRGNVNVYVYVLQDILEQEGLYFGKKNGLLTGSTISAFNAYCRNENIASSCFRGPLSTDAVDAFSKAVAGEV